jgi:uncharacterized membrane protein
MELLFLKLIHIFTGAFWAGAVIFMAAFVGPAAADAGPAGGNFMQKLMARKVPIWMMIASILNILTGFRLMAIDSGGFSNAAWFSSGMGMSLSIGAAAAIIAIIIGMTVNRPAAAGMEKMAKEIGGNPPTAEQTAKVAELRKKLTTGNNTIAILLSITLILMSIARYVDGAFM